MGSFFGVKRLWGLGFVWGLVDRGVWKGGDLRLKIAGAI